MADHNIDYSVIYLSGWGKDKVYHERWFCLTRIFLYLDPLFSLKPPSHTDKTVRRWYLQKVYFLWQQADFKWENLGTNKECIGMSKYRTHN